MTVQAAQTQYRQEYIATFEEGQSWLRRACTTEFVKKGNTVKFLVSGTNSATAVNRGANGLIPSRTPSNTQTSATLAEWHDLQELTDFDIFASQGDQRRIMQDGSVKVVNRKIDSDIIAQLDTATNDTGTAVPATVDMWVKSLTILGNNFVPVNEEDNMFALISFAFNAYMMQTPEYAHADYVDVKAFAVPTMRLKRFNGVNIIVHPAVTGVGTTLEKCYMFHRASVGHAMDKEAVETAIGYDDKHKISWARASGYFGSALLQNSGVVQMKHDGSAYVAA